MTKTLLEREGYRFVEKGIIELKWSLRFSLSEGINNTIGWYSNL